MKTTQEKYNGYTNWETWNVVLWSMNEESAYRYIISRGPYSAARALRIALDLFPGGTPDMETADDFDKVNWNEVAEAWNENL